MTSPVSRSNRSTEDPAGGAVTGAAAVTVGRGGMRGIGLKLGRGRPIGDENDFTAGAAVGVESLARRLKYQIKSVA